MTIDPKNKLRLHHIAEAAGHIADFIDGVSREEFEKKYRPECPAIY